MPSKKPNTRGTLKQDLTAARAELKQFRSDVAALKRKGLLEKELYDARSATPTKYLKSVIKKFGNVLKGEATPVKVSKAKQKYYKEKGYAVKNGRVIVPVQKNEKVYSSHGDFRKKITGTNGSITVIDLGLDKSDVLRWADDLRNNRYKLKKDEMLRFQMGGHNSYSGFINLEHKTAQEQMADYIEFYPSFEKATNEYDPEQVGEYIEGIVILKVKRDPKTHRFPLPPVNIEATERSQEAARRRSNQRKQSREFKLGNMGDIAYEKFMNEKAAEEKARRAALTPEQREEYKRKARERAAKARANKKGK